MRNKKLLCSVISLLVIMMILLTGCANESKKATKSLLGKYTPISIDNDVYTLDVTDEGRVVLYNKTNGTYTYSYPDGAEEDFMTAGQVMSAISISSYVDQASGINTAYSYDGSVLMGGLTVNKHEKEIVAEYYFLMEEITVPVHYTLDGEKLVVTVLPEEIEEATARIVDVSIHPYLGCGTSNDQGFIFVPDGSGAIVEFNQLSNSEYKQKLYSRDESLYSFTANELTAPSVMSVFGIGVNGKGSCFGIITGGAQDAYVCAVPGNNITGYNAVYPTFNVMSKDIRDYPNDWRSEVDIVPEDKKDTGPMQVTYYINNDPEPSYMDLAKTYREYLIEKYGIEKMTESSYPMTMDITMSTIKGKSFIGLPYDGVEVLTTAKQANEMVNFFKSNGIETAVKLNNWSKETVWNKIPDDISFVSSIGSKKAMSGLLKSAGANGSVYLGRNTTFVTGGNIFQKSNKYAKNSYDTATVLQNYNIVTRIRKDETQFFLSNNSVINTTDSFLKVLSDKFDKNVGVSFDNLNTLQSDFSANETSMTATAASINKALALVKDRAVAVTGGSDYTLGYTDFIFSMPSSSSAFDITSYDIPFYQIVLHGYVPYSIEAVNSSANPDKAMLKTLECGSNLSFNFINAESDETRYSTNDNLYNATFSQWKDYSLDKWNEFSKIQADKQNQLIVDYKRLTTDVTYTEYENGDAVIVNYSDEDYNYNGTIVNSMGYAQVKGVK